MWGLPGYIHFVASLYRIDETMFRLTKIITPIKLNNDKKIVQSLFILVSLIFIGIKISYGMSNVQNYELPEYTSQK